MKDCHLLSRNFFLFQDKYPAFYYKKRIVVFCYGKFVVLSKNSRNKINFPKLRIGSKKFNPKEPIITFITTKRCNMRCIYCSVRAGENSTDLSFENAKLLIDNVCRSGRRIKKLHAIFFGGEPTLSIKLIEDIIHYIKNKKIIIDQMLSFLRKLHYLGVKVVHFEPLNICGRASDNIGFLKVPDLYHYIKEYKKCIDFAAKKNMKIVNGLYDNLFSPNHDYCSAATGQKIVLTPNGLITRCYEVQEEGAGSENYFIVGRILKNKLKINRKKENKLKKIMTEIRNYCKNCFAKYICSGGCTIRTYRHISDPKFDLSYRCNLAKEIIADVILRLWKQEKKMK